MATDNVISIGATVDKSQVDAGLEEVKANVAQFAKDIDVTVGEVTAKQARAWQQIPDAAKEAMAQVSDVQRRAAEATLANQNAIRGVAAAVRFANQANTPYEMGVRAIAGAQKAAAAASAEYKTAMQEAGLAAKEAAGEAALSWRSAVMKMGEDMALVKNSVVGAFSKLNDVLMITAVVGTVREYVDQFAELNIELDHLSVKTGIAIEDLSGLQAIVQLSGGSWDAWRTALMRMEKNLGGLDDPSKQLVESLAGVGIQIKDLQGLNAEDALNRIAVAFAGTSDHAKIARAAVALFGRGGQEAIPILKEYGGELRARIKDMAQHTGVTKESDAASKQWTEQMADLKIQLRSMGTPIVEFTSLLVQAVRATAQLIRAVAASFAEGLAAIIAAPVRQIMKMVTTVADAVHGKWSAVLDDLKQIGEFKPAREGFDIAGAAMGKEWQSVWSVMTGDDMPHLPRHQEGSDDNSDQGDGESDPAKGGKSAGPRLSAARIRANAKSNRSQGFDVQSPDLKEATAATIDNVKQEAKAAQDAAKDRMAADREAAKEKIRLAKEDYEQTEKNTQFEVEMGRMTPQQRLVALRNAAAQEKQIVEQQSQFLQMIDMGNAEKYREDLRQEVQEQRNWAAQINDITRQLALLMKKAAGDAAFSWKQQMQKAFRDITAGFNENVSKWIVEGGHFRQMMQQTINGITEDFLKAVLRQTEEWTKGEILKVARHALSRTQMTATDAAGTAQGVSIEKSANATTAFDDAKMAAKGTYKVVSSWPVVGPILAPILAAGAFAAVEAFDEGGVVGNRRGITGIPGYHVPILAEAGERALTPSQNANFERLVNQSSSSNVVNNHYHDETHLSGIDGASVEGMYRRNAAAGRREFMRQMRLANAI